jgi:hypothetical protein
MLYKKMFSLVVLVTMLFVIGCGASDDNLVTNGDTVTLVDTDGDSFPNLMVVYSGTQLNNNGQIDFGTVNVGSSKAVSVKVYNVGEIDLTIGSVNIGSIVNRSAFSRSVTRSTSDSTDFTVDTSSMSSTVVPTGDTTFNVNFSPSSGGDKSQSVTIQTNDSDESTFTIDVAGKGIELIPVLNVQGVTSGDIITSSINYGGSYTRTFVIENTGNTDLTISNIAVNTPYTIDKNSLTIPMNETRQITVSMAGNNSGTYTEPIIITSNSGEFTINMSVTVSEQPLPVLNIPEISNGGSETSTVDYGVLYSKTYTINNTGDSTLTISNIAKSDNSFTLDLSSTVYTVNAGSSTTFTVNFMSNVSTTHNNTVTVNTNGGNWTFNQAITVNAQPLPVVNLPQVSNGGSLSYTVNNSQSDSKTYIIQNTGNASMTISSITKTGSYDTLDLSGINYTIPAGGSTSFTVNFQSAVSGTHDSTISINTNGGNWTFTSSYNVSDIDANNLSNIYNYNIYDKQLNPTFQGAINASDTTITQYNSNNEVAMTGTITEFSGTIQTIIWKDSASNVVFTDSFTYMFGKLIRIHRYDSFNNLISYKTFTYNASNQIERVDLYDYSDNLTGFYLFTYSGSYLNSKTVCDENSITQYTIEYTFSSGLPTHRVFKDTSFNITQYSILKNLSANVLYMLETIF